MGRLKSAVIRACPLAREGMLLDNLVVREDKFPLTKCASLCLFVKNSL